jgi:hypothetical protein
MADKRINALTTTSASVGDDYFAIDGATNGTRALSAFSPTFGGNATVTGTLTVNGTSTFNNTLTVSSNVGFIGKSGSGTGGNWRYISDDGTSRWLSGILGSPSETAFDIYDIVNGRSLLTLTAAGVVKVPQTTASTTTSSGALVIGNGTQGGLGVGGAVNIGGTLTVNGTNVSSIPRLSLNSPVETYNFAAINTIQSADVSLEVTSTAATGVGLGMVVRRTNGGEFARFINGAVTTRLANMSCDAAGTYFSISSAVGMYLDSTKTMFTGGNVLIGGTTDIPGTGCLKVFGTTASTTTSSGALVVSGGVGVAGNTNIGGVASVGGSSSAAVGVYVINTALTGTDQYGVASEPIWTSAANLGHTLWARTKTAASAFTLTAGHGVFVEIPTLGAGSAITNNYGVRINNQGTTGVTNAYGLYVASQSGASTLNYAIYTAGGRINFQGLPTSSAGLPAGTLWNDSGTLKVA